VRDEISDLARLLNLMFDRLERSFQQIRRFTAEASHELKTPLSLVRLQAEKLLVHGKLDPDNEESVHVLLEETSRLSQIIEELLFLSRAEGSDIRLSLEPHEPAALLAGFSQDARVLAEHCGMHFECTHAGSGSVLVEPRWLRRVLLNLLSNALKVSPRGGRVTLNSELDGMRWRVSLDDQGPGVAPEFRERIFERFFRVTRPGADDDAGSGLGLAICRSIISLHGGSIWAEPSPVLGGLRMVFTLPARA
jgi:two-component system heavy metal sensor histidine kinase CusS